MKITVNNITLDVMKQSGSPIGFWIDTQQNGTRIRIWIEGIDEARAVRDALSNLIRYAEDSYRTE